MSAIGPKRTFLVALHMSANDPKRTSTPYGIRLKVATIYLRASGGSNEAAA